MDVIGVTITLVVGVLPLVSLIYIVVGIKYLRNFRHVGLNYFSLMLFACAIYSIGYFLEVNSGTSAVAFLVRNFEYFGVAFVPSTGILFIMQLAQLKKIIKSQVLILFGLSALLFALYLTNPFHYFFYRSIEFVMTDYGMAVLTIKGPFYYLLLAYYSFFMLSALAMLFKSYRQARQRNRLRSLKFLILAFQIPWLAIAFIVFGFDVYVDPTPFMIALMCSLFALNEIRNDMFQLVIHHWRNFYDTVGEPAFLTDAEAQILCANPAGQICQQQAGDMPDTEFLRQLDDYESSGAFYMTSINEDVRWYVVKKSVFGVKNILTNYIFSDVTKKRLEEEQLIKAKEQAEEASLMKSRFLANMSHELRTPMHGIMGYLDLMRDGDLSQEQMDFLAEAKSASEILLYLINDILDFSKIEAGKLSIEKVLFNIREVLDDAVSVFKPRAVSSGLKMKVDVAAEVPDFAMGDPARLRQILHNIIGNAVKFTSKGEIQIRLELSCGTDTGFKLSFAVQDTGIGIPEEVLPMLFQPFVQADETMTRRFGGTGLGLAITFELVKLMHGEIAVQSVLGEGSLFSFVIQVDEPAAADLYQLGQVEHFRQPPLVSEGVGHNATLEEQPVRLPRILLVEDNNSNRMLAMSVLKRRGWTCDIALNGLEALEMVQKNVYDIVLMDCQMPVMDGYESTRRIRQLEGMSRHTTIIAMTANAMEGDRAKCLAAGMDDYLSKPLNYPQLLSLIAKASGIEPEIRRE
jgi:signal transduction histidine kinase/CheY-like chemotaxis protein